MNVLMCCISGGSFGQVYLGIDLHSGQEVAVKVMPKERGKLSRERTLQKLVTEVAILSALQECPTVAKLVGYFEEEEQVHVVTEFCSGGDLQKVYEVRATSRAACDLQALTHLWHCRKQRV
jgi:serine/threonine protein kinase